jgi:hypothetical protein
MFRLLPILLNITSQGRIIFVSNRIINSKEDQINLQRTGRPSRPPRGDTNAHSSRYFNILYMGPFLWRILMILQFFIFIFNLIVCIRTTSQSTDVQHITSLHQIAYVQRIRCIKK